MIRVILLTAIILGATISAAYTLNQLDQIVHGQLYSYGLTFSFDWANPYWNLLRITLILLDVIAVSTVISLALTLRKYRTMKKLYEKKTRTQDSIQTPNLPISLPTPSPQRKFEKPQATPLQQTVPITIPAPTTRTTETTATLPPATSTHETSGPDRCSHCGKAFSQPLRMLDFQGDRPRIVNICPFCNETIASSQTRKDDNQTTENPAARTIS